MAAKRNLVSLVVPCFSEEEVIEETHRRLVALAESQSTYVFEFLFVDDGTG